MPTASAWPTPSASGEHADSRAPAAIAAEEDSAKSFREGIDKLPPPQLKR